MRNTNKKGFTIVELVIVVAVIAILAAVLIPTFAGIIDAANESNDTAVAKNMNVALAKYSAINGDPENFDEVLAAIEEAGYILPNLNAKAEGNLYGWDSANNQIVYINAAGETLYKNVNFNAADLKFVVANDSVKLPAGYEGVGKIDMTKPEGPKAFAAAIEDGKSVTLAADIELERNIAVTNDVTINLNGHNFDASEINNRPFDLYEQASITIDATGTVVDCATFGLIDAKAGSKCDITIIGGTFNSDSDYGAFIKVRDGSEVNVTLKDVKFTDAHTYNKAQPNYILNAGKSKVTLNIEGGEFAGNIGFCGVDTATITGAKFKTEGVAIYAGNATITNCEFEIGNYEIGSTPTAAVAMSGDGTVEVNNCTITSAGMPAFRIYSGNGTIKASGCTITGANEMYVIHAGDGKIIIDGVEQ